MDRNTVERAVQTETDAKSRIKRSGQARLVYVKGHTPQPHRVKVNLRGQPERKVDRFECCKKDFVISFKPPVNRRNCRYTCWGWGVGAGEEVF